MRTTVKIAHGHKQEQYESMPRADAPESEWQELIGSKKERAKRSRDVAAKAAQVAMGVLSNQ